MSISAQKRVLGTWLARNSRSVLRALARSDEPAHRELAAELAPLIGATLDRLDDLPPVRATPFMRR